MTILCSNSEKKSLTIFCSKKDFLNNFIWTQGGLFDKPSKKRQKTKIMLNVWKDFFIGKIFGNTCLPSKSPSGSVESRSDNSPNNFPPKIRFFHKILKKIPTPGPRFWKELSNWLFFQELFSRRNLYGQIETQFWQFVFKVQKSSAECLENVLKTLIQPKKNRLPKKNHPVSYNLVLAIMLKLFKNST